MNPRTTAILFVVAAALGAFVWLYELEGEEGRKAAEESSKRLFPAVEAEAVEWISLTTADGHPARLERQPQGGWRLTAPIAFPADAFAADGIASALAQLASESSWAEPQPPEVYGLGEGASEIAFSAAGQEHRVRLGGKTPMGGNTYVSVGGAKSVHAVRAYRVTALSKRLDELRDKRIVDFATDRVDALRVRWPGGSVALAREGGVWKVREPVEGKADAATVDSVLSNLSFLRASGFVDAVLPDAESGLDAPELEVELELAPEKEGGEKRHVALAMGKPQASGERLVRSGAGPLFRVPAARIDDTPRALVAYRFKDLSAFAAEGARRVEMSFRAPDGSAVAITATRDDEGEWSSAPEAMDPEKIRTLVDELARLRARDILADAMGPEELRGVGLEPPNATLLVRGEDANAALAEVRLGVVREGGGIVAQAAGTPMVYELDPALAEYLPASLDAFRTRFVKKPEPPPAGASAEAPAEGDAQAP